MCASNELPGLSLNEFKALMSWVTIELTKWTRVISPCMGGAYMPGFIVVLVGTMSSHICTRITPMPWALIVVISLVTPSK